VSRPIKWFIPKPMNSYSMTKEEEQSFFYGVAEEFAKILGEEVKVNNGYGINFKDEEYVTINYSSKGFEFYTRIEQNRGTIEELAYDDRLLFIAWLYITSNNQGTGTKIMMHFLEHLSDTSIPVVTLNTRDKDGQRFWKRLGFAPYNEYNGKFSKLDWYLRLPYIKSSQYAKQ